MADQEERQLQAYVGIDGIFALTCGSCDTGISWPKALLLPHLFENLISRARVSSLEAAGWLEHAHVSIHPRHLARRDHGITSSYTSAAYGDRLGIVLSA